MWAGEGYVGSFPETYKYPFFAFLEFEVADLSHVTF